MGENTLKLNQKKMKLKKCQEVEINTKIERKVEIKARDKNHMGVMKRGRHHPYLRFSFFSLINSQ